MKAIVSIIMGSTSDMPVMKKAAEFLNDMEIPFEINALSAHRTPEMVEDFASNAGVEVEIEIAEGLWHVYPLFAFIPGAKKSLKEAVRFIDEHNKLKN